MRILRHALAALPAFSLLGLLAAPPAHAQLSVAANAGTVRYEQAASEQTAGFVPELRLESRHVAFALAGALTGGSDGSRIIAGGPSLWAATSPVAHHILLDGQASFQYTSPRGDSTSYAAMGVGEIAFTSDGPGFAVGVGGGVGQITGGSAVNALKGRARSWFDAGPVSMTVAVEPTVIAGSWYADASVGGSREFGRVETALTVRLRQARGSGTSAGAELEGAWHITGALAVQASAGRYLRDPFQGLPAGNFLTVGLKYVLWKPRPVDSGRGVDESPLEEVDFGSAAGLAGHGHGGGNSLLRLRNVPGVSHGNSGSSGSGGRGHKP